MSEPWSKGVKVRDLELGNELYLVEGVVDHKDGKSDVVVGKIRRVDGKKNPELPANRRGRLLLKHGIEIRKALIVKAEGDFKTAKFDSTPPENDERA
jgi:hypothetical protein